MVGGRWVQAGSQLLICPNAPSRHILVSVRQAVALLPLARLDLPLALQQLHERVLVLVEASGR